MEPAISEVSRFLREIPAELLDGLERPGARNPQFRQERNYKGTSYNTVDAVQGFLKSKGKGVGAKGAARGAAGSWTVGTRVKHPKYGFGTVLRTEGSGADAKLTISFSNYGLKKVIAKFASLTVV
jgi:DNA helicase-2/ATP-dependent DNA helicase PcrA